MFEYADIIALSNSDIGRTGTLKHQISTGDAPPIRQWVRRIPPHHRQEVQELLAKMRENDVITPSNSIWASPVVLVKRTDGSIRF